MKTSILTTVGAVSTAATIQQAAAIQLQPRTGCGMTELCWPPAPVPPGGVRP